MSDNNALNLVDQLLNNEKDGKKPVAKKQTKVYKKKKVTGPAEFKGNPGFDPDKKEAYWAGDTLKISKEMKEKAHLPDDAFIVVVKTPTSCAEASVFCPWYSIHGWGASTMDAVEACINNIADYWKNYPDLAEALVTNFEGYTPRRKQLSSLLPKKDGSAADILMAEGL